MKVVSMVVLLTVMVIAAWLDCARSSTRRNNTLPETTVQQHPEEQSLTEDRMANRLYTDSLVVEEERIGLRAEEAVDLSLYTESLDSNEQLQPAQFVEMIQEVLSRTLPPDIVNVQAECAVVWVGQQISSINCLLFDEGTESIEKVVTQESAVEEGAPPSLWEVEASEFEQELSWMPSASLP